MEFSSQWNDLLNQVRNFTTNHDFTWFRGQSKSNTYKLHSGLFRDKFRSIEQCLDIECKRMQEFMSLGHLNHQATDWDLLFIMQHHGVKTRLLDWSESFATALFFAYLAWEPQIEDACVWMFSPTELNIKSINLDGLRIPGVNDSYIDYINEKEPFPDNAIALYPVRSNKRIVAQQGVFTFQGNSMLPLDQEFGGSLVSEGHLIKLNLTEELFIDVQHFLKLSGVNYYTLFPDLDGLAKHVNMLDKENERKLSVITK